MVPTALLARDRPHLVKVLLLPAGYVVRFDGHTVTSVRDTQDIERFAAG